VNLSPAQLKAVFAVVVVVLVALGYWLVLPKVSHAGANPAASGSAPAQAQSPAQSPPQAQSASPGTTAPPTAAGSVNIYSWLPFTEQDLADAAVVAVRFCVDYNTYSYTESAAAYVATMNGLITGELAATLQATYQTPGVASTRTGQKQVSTGTAAISSLRAFGQSSLTFVVSTTQHLVSSHGTSNGNAQYAVTLTGSGTSWQVSDIELSTAGNS
jgi:hypothetical protein